MLIVSWYRNGHLLSSGFKKNKGYKRLRVGRLYIAWMENKRARHMLIRELSPKVIRPEIKESNND